MKTLNIDDKWSVAYDPDQNDAPKQILRYGIDHLWGPSDWRNDSHSMFHALLEARDAKSLAANDTFVAEFLDALADRIHAANVAAGWWTDIKTGESILHSRNVPEMLCLIHSEVSEAMEGHRKGLMDDKLPHRPMLQTELADAIIRILDLAGSRTAIERATATCVICDGGPGNEGSCLCGKKLYPQPNPIGTIMVEKLTFNRTRPDHKIENRLKEGGKKI